MGSFGSYAQDWELVADVHLGNVVLTQNDSHVEMFLGVCNNGDYTLDPYGWGMKGGDHLSISLDLYRDESGVTERDFDVYFRTNWVNVSSFDGPLTATESASLRITFAAATKTLTAWYDEDGSGNGYSWTALRSVQINNSTANWEMNDGSTFGLFLGGSCEGYTVTTSDQVYADNFMVYGSVVPSAPILSITRSNGLPRLSITGDIGSKYAVDYVTSLAASNNWQGLVTNTLAANPLTFTDTSASGAAQRFYRARLVP
jgi:hypothetical protein